jgi:hypothetical protein
MPIRSLRETLNYFLNDHLVSGGGHITAALLAVMVKWSASSGFADQHGPD